MIKAAEEEVISVMVKQITQCRICSNRNLVPIIDLGEQTLTGVFPKSISEKLTSGPLRVVKCFPDENNPDVCGLVQLAHGYSNEEMYGLNYGYRSGLNQSMVSHLQSVAREIASKIKLNENDLILDIGSNDSTLLRSYPNEKNFTLAGIDPTGFKFKKYYPENIHLIPDFFSAALVKKHFSKKAKVVTSIAMFYDLERPMDFVKEVFEILDDDGIWVLEQSYLLMMLEATAYDTICHEHAEYYALRQIQWMMDKAGFKILDIELNDVNGGSFKITAGKRNSSHADEKKAAKLIEKEKQAGLDTLLPYKKFEEQVILHKKSLCKLVQEINAGGKLILGYGASTKGNVMLQYCGLTNRDIPFIAEVNEDKFGCYTPATHIPVISEKAAAEMKPDYYLVLPWHFRNGIIQKEINFLNNGGKLIFPLPEIEIFSQ
jgi:hypothetical protein